MNDLIIDIARKSIYDKDYILDVMAKDYIGKYFGFNKKTLEELFQTRGLKNIHFYKTSL
jgi:hypothetical protein